MAWQWLLGSLGELGERRMADDEMEASQTVTVGTGRIVGSGSEGQVKDGDRVLYPPSSGIKATVAGKEILLVRKEDILAVQRG